jgi:hypothetical protein
MIGGNCLLGNIAMMRVKLNLTDKEIMKRPWIVTQIESADFPYWSSTKKKVISSREEADKYLSKYY